MKNSLCLFLFSILLFSCGDDENNNPDPDAVAVKGLTYGISDKSFKATDSIIVGALEALTPINIFAQVNHSDNAASVGKELDSTKVIIFGNPNLGTPLMKINQLVGLELPQKLFIYRSTNDSVSNVKVGFNNASYFQARYGLVENDTLFTTIETALKNFVSTVSGQEVVSIDASTLSVAEGIITKVSTKSFEETYNTLVGAITGNENLRLVAELDHQANAATINMELNPTRLVIFGNPNLGTPLMQNAQTTGIDLPQKILVWQDDQDVVKISYNDPAFLKTRHTITDNEDVLSTITNALDNLSNVAAGL